MISSLMFVLPVSGGSGGAHSVMQEADAMWSLGVPVTIATNAANAPKLRQAYKDLVVAHRHIAAYSNPEGLSELIAQAKPDVVVATTNQSVHALATAVAGMPGVRTAYYVQDYEPLFYEPHSDDWHTAYKSFGLIPGMIHFAKTRWLQEVVHANHGVQVAKVEPSVDHKVYYPDFRFWHDPDAPLTIVAMIRPSTPRRAPRRTVRILSRLRAELQQKVRIVTFGCSEGELAAHDLRLDPGIENLGVLKREEVGDLFRTTDLFLDLSDFQAFGRTAVEAMSCGAICVVPAHGGVYEFAVDGKNAFIVDVRFDDLILNAVRMLFAMNRAERVTMRQAAIAAGYAFSPERAALSELAVLAA